MITLKTIFCLALLSAVLIPLAALPGLASQQIGPSMSSTEVVPQFYVLNFYASGSRQYKLIKPLLEQACTRFGKDIAVITVDLSQPHNQSLIKEIRLTETPTIMVVNAQGDPVSVLIGKDRALSLNAVLYRKLQANKPIISAQTNECNLP